MMSVKCLVVLCIGVLLAQGNAQRPAPGPDFDYVIKLLDNLEIQITREVRDTVESLMAALQSVEDLSTTILNDLATEMQSAVAAMLEKISLLQEEAYELGIDISDCVDDSLDVINDLPEELLGVTAECLNDKYLEAVEIINEAISIINNETAIVDQYWARIEECASRDSSQQEICIRELESEIGRDSVTIPDEIALFAEEAFNYINTLKTDLLICTSGKIAYLAEIGDAIVANVTACAMNKINPTTTVSPTTTAEPTTIPPTTTEVPTTQPPTTEVPTTQSSTTEEPTTTTEVPTTQPPTTEEPTTTEVSTTQTPTTEAPTTEAPTTTEVPTTQPPTTEAPTTTEVPTTQTTTTEAPTTEAPTTTEVPTTQPPTTEAPTTTEVPTTQTPTTEAPTTEAPTTTEVPTS